MGCVTAGAELSWMPLWELVRPTEHSSTSGLLPACCCAAVLPRKHGAAILAVARPAAGTELSADA